MCSKNVLLCVTVFNTKLFFGLYEGSSCAYVNLFKVSRHTKLYDFDSILINIYFLDCRLEVKLN